MADGGLVVHFEAPSEPTQPKSTRASGPKRTGHKRQGDDGHEGRQHNAKRARSDAAAAPASSKVAVAAAQQPARRKHVVSSLFSDRSTVQPPTTSMAQPLATPRPAPPSSVFAREVTSFAELGLDGRIVKLLGSKMDPPITTPTPIQARGIPAILQGRDVVLASETGTGKTLTFVLPLVQRILQLPTKVTRQESGIVALVLSPTRELAAQTFAVLQKLLTVQIFCVPGLVTGGDHRKSEKQSLRKGINVLVATPGRLMEYLQKTSLVSFENLAFLIIDEADRMLDQGFEKDITQLIGIIEQQRQATSKGLPSSRQTILCSATIQDAVKRMLALAMTNPMYISVPKLNTPATVTTTTMAEPTLVDTDTKSTSSAELYSFPPQLVQSYAIIPIKQRLVSLMGCLTKHFRRKQQSKGIVFFSTRRSCDFHFWVLTMAPADPNNDGIPRYLSVPSRPKNTVAPLKLYVNSADNGPPFRVLITGTVPTANDGDGKEDAANVPAASDDDGDDDDDVESAELMPASAFAKTNAYQKAFVNALKPTACAGELLPHVPMYRLHSHLTPRERTATYEAFKAASKGVLFCTDVVARGIDLPGVDFVVQFDCPKDKFDYVHRVGRTARLGAPGESILFLMPTEAEYVDRLNEKGVAVSELPSDTFINALPLVTDEFLSRLETKFKYAHVNEGNPHQRAATFLHTAVEQFVNSNPQMKERAAEAFHQWLRSYATHGHSDPSVFHLKRIHQGHLAKSFGLREAPSLVKDSATHDHSAKHKKLKKKATGGVLFSEQHNEGQRRNASAAGKKAPPSPSPSSTTAGTRSRLEELMTSGRMFSE